MQNVVCLIFILFVTGITGFAVDNSHLTINYRRTIRIASGEQIDEERYPYVVGLKIEMSNFEVFFCTGSLVSPLFVLTAAHCIPEPCTVEVYLNDPRNTKNEKRNVVELFKHSLFNITSMVADICLLKIHKPFKNVNKYAIISGYPNYFENKTLLKCSILGWGKNEFDYPKNKAHAASIWVKYGPDACKVPPDNDFVVNIVKLTWKEFLCPVPDDRMVCVGDSGGPLICHGFLIGMASHGYHYVSGMKNLDTECGDSRVQTRHIFVHNYQKWVENIMRGTSSTVECYNYLLFCLTIWFAFFDRSNGLIMLAVHKNVIVTPDEVLDEMAKKPKKLEIFFQ